MDKEDAVHVYNKITLSYKKRWNTDMCNSMYTSGEYHTKWNKSDRKSKELHDFTQMWVIKLKATDEQMTSQQKRTDIYRQQYGGYQREGGIEG